MRIKSPRKRRHLRIFVLESPDPIDALQDRSEGPALVTIGRLIGHEVLTFFVRSKRELRETCSYICSLDSRNDGHRDPNRALCLHISAHGNANELGIGADDVRWEDLAKTLKPFMTARMRHVGQRVVVLSACHAERQQLSKAIESLVKDGECEEPPAYLFCTSGRVPWQDAAVGWTLFYHMLPDVDLDNHAAVRRILDRIKEVGVGHFYYFRWDRTKKKYRRYAGTN